MGEPVACEQCREQGAKYKCPGCLARTCSVACAQAHKAATGCSGKRDRTGFVKRGDYDANTMMSDYGLLQELARDHALLQRDAERQGVRAPGGGGRSAAPSSSSGSSSVTLTRAQRTIVARARDKRHVTIRYMSPGITRHQQNKTIWQSSASRLVWTLELAVPEIEGVASRWVESGFHDVCRVGDLWSRLLQAQPGGGRHHHHHHHHHQQPGDKSQQPARKRARDEAVRIQLPSDDGNEYQFRSAIAPEQLAAIAARFGAIPVEDLVWLIRIQDRPANRPAFCTIDPRQPLFTQLLYQTVIEFPTIYVFQAAPATMAHRELAIDAFDEEQRQMMEQMEVLSTRSAGEAAAAVEHKAAAVRAAITRGDTVDALGRALAEPPYGRGLEAAQAANAQLVGEILMATRVQDIGSVVGGLTDDDRDVLLKYIYHGLARPAAFNCGVLLGWHERIVEAGGLGSIVRVLADRRTV
ncbi:arp2/3 complex subunit [Coemansia javaensis]|uniref:Actin-related protein 2/3 complex subunit 5 n=1 Tax=Coemansia javaensis TaxID=2761396 RepID=A0A9W8LF47_9FUNG|nr:arp2/3 complex subunit [Coemansia javaensis]